MSKKEKAKKSKKEEAEPRVPTLWRPFGELLSEWPRLSEALVSRRLLPRLLEDLYGEGASGCVPAVDVAEDDARYTITAELPGVRPEDVHAEVRGGMLTIRGEKKSEREETGERRHYLERSYGSFSRSFTLPGDADAEHLEATFKDGVLKVAVPRTEERKARAVAIKTS